MPDIEPVELSTNKENNWPPGGLYIAAVLLFIFLYREPDLLDALIHFLMSN